MKNVIHRSRKIRQKDFGLVFFVYSGKVLKPVMVRHEMLGYSFGSFVFTRKLVRIDKKS